MTAPARENTVTFPLYERIAATYRDRITSGALPPGTKLPTVDAIKAEFGSSVMPVRTALFVLRQEGLIVFSPGVGNVVAERKPDG